MGYGCSTLIFVSFCQTLESFAFMLCCCSIRLACLYFSQNNYLLHQILVCQLCESTLLLDAYHWMVSDLCCRRVFRVLLTSAWQSSLLSTGYRNWSCAAKARCLNHSRWRQMVRSSLRYGLNSHYQKLQLIEQRLHRLSCHLVACCDHLLSFGLPIPLLDFGRFNFRLVIVSSNYRFACLRSDLA